MPAREYLMQRGHEGEVRDVGPRHGQASDVVDLAVWSKVT